MINEKEKRKENFMYLMVEFPRVVHKDIEYAIVYFEKDGDETTQVSTKKYCSVLYTFCFNELGTIMFT